MGNFFQSANAEAPAPDVENKVETPVNPPTTSTEPGKGDFGGVAFSPANGGDTGGFIEASESDVFTMAYGKLDEFLTSKPGGTSQSNISSQRVVNNAPGEAQKLSEFMPEEFIEVSVSMYVEMLEGINVALCQMFGDENGDYFFNKVYKKKYEEIMVKYARHQNIRITPGQLAVFATIALMFPSAMKAWKHRRARIKVEKFNKTQQKTVQPGGQPTLFEVPAGEQPRKNYEIDENGMFVKNPDGSYCKQANREKCPENLIGFIREFYSKNTRYPNPKEIKTFKAFE